VSFIGSPTYNLSKHLSKILTPFTNLAEQKLKNTIEAKECLQNLQIPENSLLISFDVKSLFTSIPQDLALECIESVLNDNNDLLLEQT